jgi:hypothetical protein
MINEAFAEPSIAVELGFGLKRDIVSLKRQWTSEFPDRSLPFRR